MNMTTKYIHDHSTFPVHLEHPVVSARVTSTAAVIKRIPSPFSAYAVLSPFFVALSKFLLFCPSFCCSLPFPAVLFPVLFSPLLCCSVSCAVSLPSLLFYPRFCCSLLFSGVLHESLLFSPLLCCSVPSSAVLSPPLLFCHLLCCSVPVSTVLSSSLLFCASFCYPVLSSAFLSPLLFCPRHSCSVRAATLNPSIHPTPLTSSTSD